MRQAVWFGVAAVSAVAVAGFLDTRGSSSGATAAPNDAFASSAIGGPEAFFIPSAGAALATAAFGMSALQPETYDGEMVLDLIDASPLDPVEKRELAADLAAAERGRADLDDVLADVRIALAVE